MIFADFRDVGDTRLRVPGFQVLMTIGTQPGIGSDQSQRPFVIAVAGRTPRIAEHARMQGFGLLGFKREMPADFLVTFFTRPVRDVYERLLVAGTAVAAKARVRGG